MRPPSSLWINNYNNSGKFQFNSVWKHLNLFTTKAFYTLQTFKKLFCLNFEYVEQSQRVWACQLLYTFNGWALSLWRPMQYWWILYIWQFAGVVMWCELLMDLWLIGGQRWHSVFTFHKYIFSAALFFPLSPIIRHCSITTKSHIIIFSNENL